MKNFIVFIILMLFFTCSSYGLDTINSAVVSVESKAVDTALDTQISLLKLENELLASHNKQIIDILIFSIGFGFTVLITFLVMVGYFQSRRLSQDREAMIDFIEKNCTVIDSNIKSDFVSLKEANDHTVEGITHKYEKELGIIKDSVKSIIDESTQDIHAVMNKKLEEMGPPLLKKIDKAQSSIIEVRNKVKLNEINSRIQYYELKKIPGNEFSAWLDFCLFYNSEDSSEYNMMRGLERVLELVTAGANVLTLEKPKLIKLLNELPETFEDISKKIKEKL